MSVCELKNCMVWRWKEQNVLGTRTENLSVRHTQPRKGKVSFKLETANFSCSEFRGRV